MSSFDPNIQKLLSAAPFFDDYDSSKGYYKILFRPAVAVQARELTQSQDILQNQIAGFADTIYKSGSIVNGCSIEFIPDLEWIALADSFINNTALAQDDPSLIGAIAIGNTTGVQAYIVAATSGFAAANPGKFFVRYTAPGPNNVTKFIPGEAINLFSTNTSYVEDIVVSCSSSVADFIVGDAVIDTQAGNTANVMASALVSAVNTSACTVTITSIQSFFGVGDYLVLQSNTQVFAPITSLKYNTGSEIGSIFVLTSNLTSNSAFSNTDALGFAYGAFVSDGLIYQNGFFVDVNSQTVVVNPANSNPANFSIGFKTTPTIVDQFSDASLNDNALGYSNYNAPGAYRLQLTANLVAWTAADLSANNNLLPVAQFSNSGVLFEKTDPQYSVLGNALAQRTYEEAGHFIVNPFIVSSHTNSADANSVILNISPGLAYVEGERVELLNNLNVVERRGTDTKSYLNRVITTSYGNYVSVNQLRGYFAPSNDSEVLLYDTAQTSISSAKNSATAIAGTEIGTATLRAITASSAIQGTPNSTYNMYLFDIQMANNSLSFANVKSICATSSFGNSFADVVTIPATLTDASFTPMLFSIGGVATQTLSSANTFDTNYYYTATSVGSSTLLDTTGKLQFSVPPGGGELGFGVGQATTPELAFVTVTMLANTQSANLSSTANVFANGTIVCGATDFGTSVFYPGAFIGTPGGTFNVTATINSTAIQTTASGAQSSVHVWRVETEGSVVPLDGITRTLTFSNSTAGYANLGLTYESDANAAVSFYAYNVGAGAIGKKINRSTTVLIQPSANGTDAGPWNIGLPDVVAVTAAYVVANNSGVLTPDFSNNVVNDFIVDTGQRDGFYDLATLTITNGANVATYANVLLVLLVDHYTAVAPGGFFSIDSYPIDDSIAANTLTTVTTASIPNYYSTSQQKTYNLRDCVDFRPYKAHSANIGNAISTATLNPTETVTFDANTTGFTPFPSGNFTCNVTQYLGRKDVLLLSSSGSFNIAEGMAGSTPQYPTYDANTNLSIAKIVVPPYPSLPSNEATLYQNASTDYDLQVLLQSHRRYTMKDIGDIDTRVSQLEYYTTLNTLENAAASTTVINGDGLEQFKNGIFVDPINNFSFSDVEAPQYTMAIDPQNGFGRPRFQSLLFDVDYASNESQNIQQTGKYLSIAYTVEPYIQQLYASDNRHLSGLPPSYVGSLSLYPNFWSDIEPNAPAASISSDGSPASVALARLSTPPLTVKFGWWRQFVNSIKGPASDAAQAPSALRQATSISGQSASPTTYALNDTTQVDVSVQPYLSARQIAFVTSGLKPYTTFNIYVDNTLANSWSAPGTLNPGATNDDYVTRTKNWGSALQSDSKGNLYGKIALPGYTLHAGRHTVTLVDTLLDDDNASTTTGCSAAFTASIIYQKPKPVPVSLPAPTPPAPPPVAPSAPAAPPEPIALFWIVNTIPYPQTVAAPAYPTLYFRDNSASQVYPIVSWDWDFGDGATQHVTTSDTVVSHTYSSMPSSTQTVNVVLTVTDSIGRTAKAVHSYVIARTMPPIPAPQTNPTVSLLAYTPTLSGSLVSGSVVSTGTANVVISAHTSNTVPGAVWVWSQTGNTGSATTASASDNQYTVSLPPSSNASIQSVTAGFNITATYETNSTNILATATMGMSLTAQRAVPAPAPISTQYAGGCADVNSYTPYGKLIGEYVEGDSIAVCRHETLSVLDRTISRAFRSIQPCYRLTTNLGYTVVVSSSTPLEVRDKERCLPQDSLGEELPVWGGEVESPIWDRIIDVYYLGEREVNRISLSGQDLCYWAGEQPGKYISVHNVMAPLRTPGTGGPGASTRRSSDENGIYKT